jgi:hypothetical protein
VRLIGLDAKKTASVKVSVRRSGVTALSRSAFQPRPRKTQAAAALAAGAGQARLDAAVDERRPGAARLARKTIPVTLEWKGRSRLAAKNPAKPFFTLNVRVPHEELRFTPEQDSIVGSVQIAVEAVSTDGQVKESFTDDWFFSYTGDEYAAARSKDAVRAVTLELPPGRYDLNVSVNDALGDSFGTATAHVDAR